MNASQIYIAISIAILAIIAVLLLFVSKRKKPGGKIFTPLAGLAFGFILAGLFFGEERPIGYSLTGMGVILAVVDMFKRPKSKKHESMG